jgi:peptidoglycan/xylan/chitin deacetylase (PgdA/CDA1 family)
MAQSGIDFAAPDEFEARTRDARHCVGITFDDGFESDLRCAELLHKHNLRALFFIPTATIGAPGFMGIEDLRTLAAMGMKIGSHSHEHVQITPECAAYQAQTSREILAQHLGTPIEDFAFVGGVCSSQTTAAVLSSGYKRVYTMEWGVNGAAQTGTGVYKRNALVQGMSDKQFMDLISGKNRNARQSLYMLKRLAARSLPKSTYNRLQRWYVALHGQGKRSKPGVSP